MLKNLKGTENFTDPSNSGIEIITFCWKVRRDPLLLFLCEDRAASAGFALQKSLGMEPIVKTWQGITITSCLDYSNSLRIRLLVFNLLFKCILSIPLELSSQSTNLFILGTSLKPMSIKNVLDFNSNWKPPQSCLCQLFHYLLVCIPECSLFPF